MLTDGQSQNVCKFFLDEITMEDLEKVFEDGSAQAFDILKEMYINALRGKAIDYYNENKDEMCKSYTEEERAYCQYDKMIELFKQAKTVKAIFEAVATVDPESCNYFEEFNYLATLHLKNVIEMIKNDDGDPDFDKAIQGPSVSQILSQSN
jgi:hypothetical protein